jgi:M6 family metalloprotease-like protein
MAYYGANTGSGGFDVNPRALVNEAVNLANPNVDFSEFDNDNDGVVDGVYVIYAGYGEEAGASADAIWAHKWGLSPSVQLDGVWISTYSCSAELRGNSGTGLSRIGVICHEFGHVLGAPDYYDTNYGTGGSYTGTGWWDMMAGGSWNNGGATPAHHNGYTKWKYYNWTTPQELTISSTFSLKNAVDFPESYIISSQTTNEFWLLENRQQTGFDAYLPGHGMIIYHVDENGIATAGNEINATHPQYMYPVAANASANPPDYGTINSSSCPFPGTGDKTAFTDDTTPRAYSWAGQPTYKPVSNIAETSGVIYFDFLGGNAPSNFDANAISSDEIELVWDQNPVSDAVLLAFSTDGVFGNPVDGNAYSSGNSIPGGGTVLYNGVNGIFNHTGLDPYTTYYYMAWSVLPGNNYSMGVVANAKTPCMAYSSYPYTQDFSEGQLPQCWDIADHQGNGQVWHFDNPGNRTINTSSNANGFAMLDSDYYGSGNSQNSDLISPVFDFTNFTEILVEFEHYYYHYTGSSAAFSYSLDGGRNWIVQETWLSSTTNQAFFTEDMTSQLEGQSQVRFKWNYIGSYAWYWAVDDFSITAEPAIPVNFELANRTLTDGETDCFNASETITVAGTGPVFIQSGASANFIAGQSIRFLPGFHAQNGSTVNAWITTDASFCDALTAPVMAAPPIAVEKSIEENSMQEENNLFDEKSVKVFPNPNSGVFTVALEGFDSQTRVMIFNIMGHNVYDANINGQQHTIELPNIQRGVYFVKAINNAKHFDQKIVIQ